MVVSESIQNFISQDDMTTLDHLSLSYGDDAAPTIGFLIELTQSVMDQAGAEFTITIGNSFNDSTLVDYTFPDGDGDSQFYDTTALACKNALEHIIDYIEALEY